MTRQAGQSALLLLQQVRLVQAHPMGTKERV